MKTSEKLTFLGVWAINAIGLLYLSKEHHPRGFWLSCLIGGFCLAVLELVFLFLIWHAYSTHRDKKEFERKEKEKGKTDESNG